MQQPHRILRRQAPTTPAAATSPTSTTPVSPTSDAPSTTPTPTVPSSSSSSQSEDPSTTPSSSSSSSSSSTSSSVETPSSESESSTTSSTTSSSTRESTSSSSSTPPVVNGVTTSFVTRTASQSSSSNAAPSLARASGSGSSGGLSTGAVTAISVIGALAGFALVFWIAVQLMQNKRRRKESEEMERIDFDPGHDYVSGGVGFSRQGGEPSSHHAGGASGRDLAEIVYEDDDEFKEREQMYTEYMNSAPPTSQQVHDSSSMNTVGSNRAGVGLIQQPTMAYGGHDAQNYSRGGYNGYDGSGYAAATPNPVMYGGRNNQYGYNEYPNYNNPAFVPHSTPTPPPLSPESYYSNAPTMRQVNHHVVGHESRSVTPDPFAASVQHDEDRNMYRSDSIGTVKEDVGNGVGRLMLVQH